MSRYKIGATDGGDAGLDLSWVYRLNDVDGAVVITKNITPLFQEAVLANKDKLIVHATITGFGGTKIEPNVPKVDDNFDALATLISNGFPQAKITIRIDPIIPTPKGIQRAFSIFKKGIDNGFSRFRVSIIDMYPHVRERFKAAGLPLPYGDEGFSPSTEQIKAVDDMLTAVLTYCKTKSNTPRIECCAEPKLKNAIQCGCIGGFDLMLLGLNPYESNDVGYQRKHCMCYSGKTELLKSKIPCSHGCIYCFWKGVTK